MNIRKIENGYIVNRPNPLYSGFGSVEYYAKSLEELFAFLAMEIGGYGDNCEVTINCPPK